MIGYWQSMAPDDVLGEVNAECAGKSLPHLGLTTGWGNGGTTHFEHSFARPFEISPFKLRHFWVDLRK